MLRSGDGGPWQPQRPPDHGPGAGQPHASRTRVGLQQCGGSAGSVGNSAHAPPLRLPPPPPPVMAGSTGGPMDGWAQGEQQRAQSSPRSPSRLRATLHSRAAEAGQGRQQGAGDAACFIRVEHVGEGAAATAVHPQEDVCIEHIQADGARHAAEVETGIIQQVDGLVHYFNQLHSQDEATIEQLELRLAQGEEALAAMHAQQLEAAAAQQKQRPQQQQQLGIQQQQQQQQQQHQHQVKQRQPLLEHPGPAAQAGGAPFADGFWVRVQSSWAARPRAWLWGILLCLALLALIIGLAAGLALRGRGAAGAAVSRGTATGSGLTPGASAAGTATGGTVARSIGSSSSGHLTSASLAPAGEHAFNITFALAGPGTLHFVVLYASLYARFLDTFVAFDNAAVDATAAIADDLAAFTGGVVARGACAVAQGGVATSCRIGPSSDPGDEGGSPPGAFACSPAASCTVQNSCFGALCHFSRYAVVANTTYKVVAMTELTNSSEAGVPLLIGSFRTAPATSAPLPNPGLRVDPVISFDRFAVDGVGQERLGFAYVIVTRPAKQRGTLVLPGTATNFSRVVGLRRRSSRRLLQAANLTLLPPEAAPLSPGTAFMPACPATVACSTAVATDAYVDAGSEQLVRADCTPVARVSDAARLVVDGLANDTLYRVTLATSDVAGLHAGWDALLRTQDASPPALSLLDSPPPGFTAFDLAVSLNEPGLVYAALHLAGGEGPVPTPACPPTFQALPMLQASAPVAAGGARVVLSFTAGLTPNTDYTATLIARDTAGNCQRAFTRVPVHTADNVPPITLALRAANITGSSAELRIALDEAGTAFYSVAPAAAGGGSACPAADELFAQAGAGRPEGLINGSIAVPARSPVEAVARISGLASETAYAACVVAQDATSQHNRQTAPQRVAFTTLDVTPPTATLAVAPAADGGDVACSRAPPYLCNLTWSAALSEPGAVRWALVRNSSGVPLPLPPPAALMAAATAGPLFSSGVLVAEGALALPPSPSGPISLAGLGSGTSYVLMFAARDAAMPTPNTAPALALRAIVAPDVAPPVFLEARFADAADTSLGLAVRLDESGTTFFVLVPHPSDAPGVDEVLQGVAAGGAAAAASGASSSAANATVALLAGGLQPGQLYDAHLAAVDAAGNRQLNVTTISRLRTTDSTPPAITALTATWTPPMGLALSAALTKPGTLRYLARPAADPAPTDPQALLAAVAANDLVAANFTGSLAVPTAGAAASGAACIADGGAFVIYAVAQDREGDNPGRWPNNSTLSSVSVTVAAPAASVSCNPAAFLSALRPTVMFDASGPGLPLGSVNVTTAPDSGATTPRPAAAAVAVCSDYLVAGDSGATGGGAPLLLSYQLRDVRGRTAVDTSGLTLHPLLSYASAAAAPAGINATVNELPSCDAHAVDPVSGIGECLVALDGRYFPASGRVAASVSLQLRLGSPGLLIVLPSRALHVGETVVVSLAAVNPTAAGLTSWSVPLRYDSSQLELASVTADPLWLDAITSNGGLSGRIASRTVRVTGRAPGQPAERYRSSSSIPLAELEFLVRVAVPGAYPGALAVGAGARLESGSSPAWVAPPAAFYDHRGGIQTSGSVNVTATRTLGLWAWAERRDVFNTAAFNGARVTTQLRAAAVRSWGTPAAVTLAPTSCGIAAASAAAAASALSLDAAQCAVHVDAVNSGAIKDASFALSAAGASASAVLSVWQPFNVAVEAGDPTLNSVLPINAAPIAPGCTDHYQSTRLRARADWSNGGGGPADSIAAADVTPLSTFTANDSTVVLVLGAAARGVGPGAASIGLAGFTPTGAVAPAVITVTDAPVCLVALEPLATTGVGFVGPLPSPPSGGAAQLSWRAEQQLDWEDSEARVLTVASFSDGASVDVSDRVLLSLRQDPAAASPLGPFALAYDTAGSPFVRVNASVSGAGPTAGCGAYLQASWEVCARPLGAGQGRVTLALPAPTSLAGLAAAPPAIASPGDPAALPPLSLPPSSALSLEVVFSDGSRRDFSSDARTSFAVAAGATLCQVERATGAGADGPWEVTTASSGGSPGGGTCRLTASVAFSGGPPLTADIGVEVVALRALPLYALGPTQLSEQPLPPASPPLGPMLRLLRCDGRNFDQATLWPAAVLSNCTGELAACPHQSLANRAWVALSSSDAAVLSVMRGYPSIPDYATFPLLDNRLVPLAPGSATLSLAFGNATTYVSIDVADTYQPTWPRAGSATDTAVQVSANMSAGGFAISVRALPSAGLDLQAEPPSAASVVQGGVLLSADTGRGPGFYAGAVTGLSPGTNYTLLLAVGSGLSLSSGVTALVGALVPDTVPPSFTAAAVSAAAADPSGSYALTLDISLDEGGTLAYAAYPAPCLGGDPSEAELRAGATLNSSCAPTTRGLRIFPNALREAVTLTGALPPSPYEPLRAWTSGQFDCPADAWQPASYTSPALVLYLLAADDAPGHHTYRGWASECAAPEYDTAAPAGPCAPVTVVACNNTQLAPEAFNSQPLPFQPWDGAAPAGGSGPAPPPGRPLRVPVALSDATPMAFAFADVSVDTSGGRAFVFTFAVTRPSLVRYELVRNVVERVAWGLYPVFDAATNHTVVLGRDCVLGAQLAPGTAYGVWYNATDVYGAASPWRIISAPLLP
ncbi:hypothetical protein Rsub_12070 [Raphidocelis subcapitata]|uniref:Uncharacterized protein n=1 Tax=Raphidocelis subcapitata TaxID=307507 RepID=A0A2V0PIR5_9CHLO|nr:hypothetical protein Rsub_12070 [Raphidocelis subcapitata]|eukprot:GBF99606.1 hypothetical protein Rsub_12070 [Raphidocelis subcapitata]